MLPYLNEHQQGTVDTAHEPTYQEHERSAYLGHGIVVQLHVLLHVKRAVHEWKVW